MDNKKLEPIKPTKHTGKYKYFADFIREIDKLMGHTGSHTTLKNIDLVGLWSNGVYPKEIIKELGL